MVPYFTTYFGNPSSSHTYGQKPKEAVDNARIEIAKLFTSNNSELKSISENIIFTGCGTEADNLAILLAIRSFKKSGKTGQLPHIVTSNVEHPAVTEYLKYLELENEIEVSWVPVNQECSVSAQDIEAAIKPTTVLVTLIYAQNEIGSLNPVKEVSQMCRERQILFHTDAAQSVGKVPMDLDSLGLPSMVTIVGHKFGAPKGVAALYVAKDTFTPDEWPRGIMLGGGQEAGRRAGTENVPYIVGMGKALSMLTDGKWKEKAAHLESMR